MSVRVGKLTVRGAGRDAGFRVRAETRLRSLDLDPPGLPGHAILIVRRLEIPGVDPATAKRARADLDRLRQAAARPAAGPVAASAPVVLFRDEVELLACLTADLVRGVAGHRWYWRQIGPARPGTPGTALAAAWLRDVRWLPGVFASLPEPDVRQAVSLLSPPETARVLGALLSAFGVADQSAPPGPEPTRPPPGPPWRRWLRPTSLPPAAEALWGMALSLHHAPAIVRGPGYASELAAWRAVAQASPPRSPAQENKVRDPAKSASAGREPAQRDPEEEAPHEWRARPAPLERDAAPATHPAGAGTQGEGEIGGAVRNQDSGIGPMTAAWTGSLRETKTPPAAADAKAGVPAPRGMEPDTRREVALQTQARPDEGIVTGLASMLFLVNFVVWLDDRADPPWPAGWGLVELLGRYLLGDRLPDVADDPLWDVLAELDGRQPGTAPAVRLGPADPLRLPRAWLERWPPPEPGYVALRHRDRLVIRHPEAGFVAADVPCPPEAFEKALAAEPDNPGPGRRFDEAVGAFVSWLLRSRGIATPALATPGRVLVTATHVDVIMSMRDIDLAVRVAGLDRDPGWVPALGRIVGFHFLDTS